MERHYFIGEGPEAKAVLAKTVERMKICNAARKKLLKDYGADYFTETGPSFFGGGELIGLGYYEKVQRPYFKGEERTELGYTYYPRLSTKEGKALAKRLKEEKELHFYPSHFICELLGVRRCCHKGMRFFWSAAGFADGKLLLSVPGSKESEDGEDPFPEIPDWLREVKESEFLAAQGK